MRFATSASSSFTQERQTKKPALRPAFSTLTSRRSGFAATYRAQTHQPKAKEAEGAGKGHFRRRGRSTARPQEQVGESAAATSQPLIGERSGSSALRDIKEPPVRITLSAPDVHGDHCLTIAGPERGIDSPRSGHVGSPRIRRHRKQIVGAVAARQLTTLGPS